MTRVTGDLVRRYRSTPTDGRVRTIVAMSVSWGRGRLWQAVRVAVAVAAMASGCSDGDEPSADDAEAGSTAAQGDKSASTLSFEERDAALQLNFAATGLNLVATDVGLRTTRGDGADYCRTSAPAEVDPHRTVLEAAADAEVRKLAGAALGDLRRAIELCAGGADPSGVQEAIDRYNASFERLRRRIDSLLDPSG